MAPVARSTSRWWLLRTRACAAGVRPWRAPTPVGAGEPPSSPHVAGALHLRHLGRLATRDDISVHQQYIADIVASAREAPATVGSVPFT
jgi:hypothetical protein